MIPAVLGGGGVILAALITYLLTKPAEITVIVPPPERVAVAQTASAIGGGTATSADLNTANPNGDYVIDASSVDPAYTPGMSNASEPPQIRPLQAMGSEPDHPAMAVQQSSFGIPVFTPTSSPRPLSQAAMMREPVTAAMQPAIPAPSNLSAPPTVQTMAAPGASTSMSAAEDLPPAAITIEMIDARLESFTGPVSINGAIPHPGERLHVGTEIKTMSTSVASVGFARANVDLSGASSARISRLERRIGVAGTPEEDVTLHLAGGTAKTVVRPGGGSVLISTDLVTASSQAGAFTVSTLPDGGVTVSNEGGTVNLVATQRQGETFILKSNERVTYKNGVWIKE